MDTLRNINRKWLGGVLLLIILLAIPLTMYLVRQQQILRSRATEGTGISFVLNPATANQPIEQDFTVRVKLRAGTSDVSAVDLHLTADPAKVKFVDFSPLSSYSQITKSVTDSSVDYVGVNAAQDPRQGDIDVGDLRLRLLAGAALGGGAVTIDPATTRVTVLGTEDLVITSGNTNGQYGPVVSSPSPSPSLLPGQPFITDVSFDSSLPACFSSALTPDQLAKVNILWQGQPFGSVFWIDISTDSNFTGTNYYHKSVAPTAGATTFSTDLAGFIHLVTTGAAGRFNPQPGQTYYVRVFNGQANAAGTPVAGSGTYSPLRSFSTSICPSPSPSPSPTSLTCSDVTPTGLTDTGDVGSAGEKIYSVRSVGGNVRLNVTRSPVNSAVNPTSTKISVPGTNITFASVTASTDKIANIPVNVSTTEDNEYRIDTTIGSAPQTPVACPSIIVRVTKRPAESACTYFGTEVRLKGLGDISWVRNRRIRIGERIQVAAFHKINQSDSSWGYRNNNLANDVYIQVTDAQGQIFDINLNPDGTLRSQAEFPPPPPYTMIPGSYRFSGITKDMLPGTNNACVDNSANLEVVGVAATTSLVRISETEQGLNTPGQFVEYPYSGHPLTKEYIFRDSSLGDKNIWVKFTGTDTNGQLTEKKEGPYTITVVNPDPVISGVDCDLNLEGGVRFTINGANFGAQGRRVKAQSGQTNLTIDSWNNTQIVATLSQTATTGAVLPVKITRDDLVISEEANCSVATSAIQLGANLFCRQPTTRASTDVEVIIAEARDNGTVSRETVTIDNKGMITGLRTKLQEGKPYRISIKAPKSLRRTVEVKKASRGTTRLSSLQLPVGDIFPLEGDGKINSADFAQLIREWIIAGVSGERRGDFNGDGRVNSVDWACMVPDFNKSDDPEPEGRLIEGLVIPSPTPRVAPVATSSATVSTQSAAVSTGSGTTSP